ASKSSAMKCEISLAVPACRGTGLGVHVLTSVAIVVPSRRMRNSSPGRSSAINSGKRAWASCRETEGMAVSSSLVDVAPAFYQTIRCRSDRGRVPHAVAEVGEHDRPGFLEQDLLPPFLKG